MAATQSSCSLMLVVEAAEGARQQLEAALSAGTIASACILPEAGRTYDLQILRPLIGFVQKTSAAALIVDDAGLARTLKADGVHLSTGRSAPSYDDARGILGRGAIVGAEAGRSRDAAMQLGEAGADYIGFGVPDFVADRQTARERRQDLVQWWAEIFEVPCVAFDVDDAEDAKALVRAGADFVAVRLAPTLTPAEARETVSAMLAAVLPREA